MKVSFLILGLTLFLACYLEFIGAIKSQEHELNAGKHRNKQKNKLTALASHEFALNRPSPTAFVNGPSQPNVMNEQNPSASMNRQNPSTFFTGPLPEEYLSPIIPAPEPEQGDLPLPGKGFYSLYDENEEFFLWAFNDNKEKWYTELNSFLYSIGYPYIGK